MSLKVSPWTWRQDHPKCKFCKYMKTVIPKIDADLAPYDICQVKDKIVNDELPRWFCQCYEVDTDKLTFDK